MVLDNIFLLQLPPILAILIISVVITFIVTIIYKFTTNQRRMKELKDQQKKLQKEYKQHVKDPQKAMKVNQKLMKVNMEYMKHSFKATLYTFIPLILIFGWMNAHFGYEPIHPGEQFSVTASFDKAATGEITLSVPDGVTLISNATQPVADKVTWTLKGTEGQHTLTYTYGDEIYQQDVLITDEWHYLDPVLGKSGNFLGIGGDKPTLAQNSQITQIRVDLQPVKPLDGVPIIGGLTWLWVYIIISITGSIFIRKWMKVY